MLVGAGALARPAEEVRALMDGRRVFVVASRPVAELHPRALESLLEPAAASEIITVADGEAAKRPAVAADLWERLLAAGGKRDSLVVAFGGGSIGDLGGFVAATFLRGIDLVQAPTTLLAQVDAAIGGKTGVNLPAAKNSVGVFHQPIAVISDTALLASLPRPELRSGLVEAVKMAALLDLELLALIERDLPALLAGDAERLTPVVAAAAAAKARVVERDPHEAGHRKLLNFGHTLGHAIEAAAGYRGLGHGDAVGWGIRFALRLAARRGLPPEDRERLERLLDRLELPALPPVSANDLIGHLRHDKKAREGGTAWVLPRRLGEGEVVEDVPAGEVAAELDGFLAASTGEKAL